MLSLQLPLRRALNSVSVVWSSTFATLSEAQAATHYHEPLDAAVQPYSAIPGPKPLPLLRNLLKFRKHFFTLNQYLEECSDKYGEIFKLEAPGTLLSACIRVHWTSVHNTLLAACVYFFEKVGIILSTLPIPMPWRVF